MVLHTVQCPEKQNMPDLGRIVRLLNDRGQSFAAVTGSASAFHRPSMMLCFM